MKQEIHEEELLQFLRSTLLLEGPGDKSVHALLGHLADLGLLSSARDSFWIIEGIDFKTSSAEWKEAWSNKVRKLCESSKGFALKYFIKELPESVSLAYPDPQGFQGAISEGVLENSESSKGNASSNLSNLQIVKKVGRQLSPLIEMENDFLRKLEGPNTNRQQARHIFNFIISRVKMKGEPREWIQLSRRRHK
ncbi:MAG: hypothetical protein G3M70_15780 [Candidatus Nitronauta litoralis]|uniref:Uncharacterized protein n=1 Tax=Candidatus Nitronauta litoralis TaxID=2705533 RepID=A0A7T0BYI6_9BACT|nr:MAG: hypothetical protein G3M70_15780 [Candidatus Nitronauta litoralis]